MLSNSSPRVLELDRDLARLTDRSDIATKSSFEPEGSQWWTHTPFCSLADQPFSVCKQIHTESSNLRARVPALGLITRAANPQISFGAPWPVNSVNVSRSLFRAFEVSQDESLGGGSHWGGRWSIWLKSTLV